MKKTKEVLKCPLWIMALLLFIGVTALSAPLNTSAAEITQEEVSEEEEFNILKFTQPPNDEGPVLYYSEQDVLDCAWVLWYEYGACKSFTEKSKVVWTICNRVDDPRWGDNFRAVVSEPNQFAWHGEPNIAKMDEEVIRVARDVLERWNAEKNGATDVGRTLPKDSVGFYGDGQRNHFYALSPNGSRHYYYLSPSEGPYDN